MKKKAYKNKSSISHSKEINQINSIYLSTIKDLLYQRNNTNKLIIFTC